MVKLGVDGGEGGRNRSRLNASVTAGPEAELAGQRLRQEALSRLRAERLEAIARPRRSQSQMSVNNPNNRISTR